MSKPRSFLRLFTERGPLAVVAVTGALLFGIAGPASAQFFNFGGFDRRPAPPRGIPGGPPQQGGIFSPFGDPNQPQQPVVVDSSRAPPPVKRWDVVAAQRLYRFYRQLLIRTTPGR